MDGLSGADGVNVDVGSCSATSTLTAGNEVPAVTRVWDEGSNVRRGRGKKDRVADARAGRSLVGAVWNPGSAILRATGSTGVLPV